MTDLTDEASLSRVVEADVGIKVPFVGVHPDIKTHNQCPPNGTEEWPETKSKEHFRKMLVIP